MAEANAEAASTAEKRRYHRPPLRISIDYRWGNSVRMNRTANLSEDRVFIFTEDPLPEGTRLSLRFFLPEILERIDVEGKVISRTMPGSQMPAGMGLTFTGLTPGQGAMISDLIGRFVR